RTCPLRAGLQCGGLRTRHAASAGIWLVRPELSACLRNGHPSSNLLRRSSDRDSGTSERSPRTPVTDLTGRQQRLQVQGRFESRPGSSSEEEDLNHPDLRRQGDSGTPEGRESQGSKKSSQDQFRCFAGKTCNARGRYSNLVLGGRLERWADGVEVSARARQPS